MYRKPGLLAMEIETLIIPDCLSMSGSSKGARLGTVIPAHAGLFLFYFSTQIMEVEVRRDKAVEFHS
jgi:hypothetical protein